jgi:ABC-type transport system involved in multi-copper enzyme maturation permease subunit
MLGPIFSVEMLTTARRGRYFALRVLYACILFFSLAVTYQASARMQHFNTLSQSANVANSFFQSFSMLQLLAVLFVGPAMAAGTIAVERERRTIEYLFATDLTNREIVLGKLTARFLQITALVLVGMPILAAAMLMGGIAPEQLFAVFLITVSTMAVVSVLAVTMSVWAARVRDAVTRVYVLLFAALVVPTLVIGPMGYFLGYSAYLEPVIYVFQTINPFFTLARATWGGWYSSGGNLQWEPVLWMVGSHVVLITSLAALAVWAVRRVHLREAGKAPAKLPRRLLRTSRTPWESYPMVWKELATARSASRIGIVGRVAGGLIILAAVAPAVYWFFQMSGSDSAVSLVITSDFLACAGLLLVASRAATSITSEREKDTWITLLSTPVSTFDIVLGKAVGSLYAGRLILAIIVGLVIMQMLRAPQVLISAPFLLVTIAILGSFASALGLIYSLRCTNSTRALGWTLATALFVGGGYLFCCMPVAISGRGDPGEVILSLCVPVLLSIPSLVALRLDPPNDLVATYVVGLTLYSIIALVLYGNILSNFDAWNGRNDGKSTAQNERT